MFRRKPFKDISAADLAQMLESQEPPAVVDVREAWEYRLGHVPGAVLVPLGQLPRNVDKLNPSRPTVIICEHGNRSQMAANYLAQRGFDVFNVVGGTEAWRDSGLPMDH